MVEFKISDFLFPRQLLSTYFLLRKSEQWSESQIAEYQGAKLSVLLQHCALNVPYYRSQFKNLGITHQDITVHNSATVLSSIPVLTKEVLRQNSSLFLADNAQQFRPKAVNTSGTTGTPLSILWDRGSNIMELCCTQRLWRWGGVRPGESFLDIRSRLFAGQEHKLQRHGGAIFLKNWKANYIEFNSDLISPDNIRDYYEILLKRRPVLVRGHPQSILLLANTLASEGLRDWKPRLVTTNSEALLGYQRSEISRIWEVPILDSYGLKEHNAFVSQCASGSYHISPEYGIVEILDEYGKQVEEAGEGYLVATGLHNFAQPLIRYNTLDLAERGVFHHCHCRRKLPTLRKITGRIDDCLLGSNGERFTGLSFAFFGRRGIIRAKLIQHTYEQVEVKVVADSEFSLEEKSLLLRALDAKVGGQIRFFLNKVEDIYHPPGTKYKFVENHIPLHGEHSKT